MTLTSHPFASTDLRVSRLGFGCSTIASLATRHSPGEVRATLHAAVERGVTFFDTADVYGQGDSERLLGRLLARHREPLVVCTKVGMRLSQSQNVIRFVKPVLNPLLRRWRGGRARTTDLRRASERQCFEPAYLRERIEASLKRLRVERIDLLLLHSPPLEVAERDDVLKLLHEMRDAGTLRWFGVSAIHASHAPRWARWAGLSCLQLPLTPEVDVSTGALKLPDDVLSLLTDLRRQRIGVIAREVFGGGVLAAHPRARGEALAAVLTAPAVGVALVGMGSRSHLSDNLQALAEASR